MTLFRRLFITLLIGAIIFFFAVKWLYPKPAFAGDYHAATAKGSYVLRIVDRENALMSYTDKTGRKFIYRGYLASSGKGDISVSWIEQQQGDKWEPLQSPIQAKMKWTTPEHITTSEGVFKRVPVSVWRRLFTL